MEIVGSNLIRQKTDNIVYRKPNVIIFSVKRLLAKQNCFLIFFLVLRAKRGGGRF